MISFTPSLQKRHPVGFHRVGGEEGTNRMPQASNDTTFPHEKKNSLYHHYKSSYPFVSRFVVSATFLLQSEIIFDRYAANREPLNREL